MARDAQVPARIIREYYALLEDTMMRTILGRSYIDYFSVDSFINFWRLDLENEIDFEINEFLQDLWAGELF